MIFYKVTHCVSMGMSSTSAREMPSFSNIAATSTENAIQLIKLFFFITLSHGRYGDRERERERERELFKGVVLSSC